MNFGHGVLTHEEHSTGSTIKENRDELLLPPEEQIAPNLSEKNFHRISAFFPEVPFNLSHPMANRAIKPC